MKNYLKNWNIIRFLRLIVGVFVVVQGIISKEWMFVFLGGLFALMPLMNVGCGTSGCQTPRYKKAKEEQDEIHYEEIK